MTKNAKVALGAVGILAAGVLIGMLIAPEKGKDLRLKLKKNADKWGDQLSHLFHKAGKEDIKTELKDKVNKAREAVA